MCVCECACACVCVCVRVRVYMRACVRARVCEQASVTKRDKGQGSKKSQNSRTYLMDSPKLKNVKYCAKPKNRIKNTRDTASNQFRIRCD